MAKAGEVRKRVAQAETMEQKLHALEHEHERLGTIVRFEARRQMLLTRKSMLEDEGLRLVDQMQRVLNELTEVKREAKLLGEELKESPLADDIRATAERLQRKRDGGKRSSTR